MKIFKWVPSSNYEQAPVNRTKLAATSETDSNSNGGNNKENLSDEKTEKATLSNLVAAKEDSTTGFSENSLDENSTTNDKMDTSSAPTENNKDTVSKDEVSNGVLNGDSQDAQFPDSLNGGKKEDTAKK